MPGIFGLICTSPPVDLLEVADSMARSMRRRAWYVKDHHVDAAGGLALGRISLGFLNAGRQPATNEDGLLLAVMDGELLDVEGHRRALEAAGHAFRGESHAEVLLHGYERSGKGFFRTLEGTFAAAIWDARRRELILVNDRFGMKPLYYAAPGGRLVLGSEIKAVLADPAVPRGSSPRGIAQFFTFGQLLGEDTLLESVRALPAAGWLTYSPDRDRVALDRYWQAGPGDGGGRVAESEALDRIDAAFGRAIARRVRGTNRLGISLSGGLDARTILAAIDHERVPITSVTIGIEGSLDHVSSTRMAALVGCPHHRFQLGDDFLARFEEHLREMVLLTDGHYLCQCIVMPSLPAYRELGVEVLLRGHAGELMHMDKAYNFSLDRRAMALRDAVEMEAWLFGRLRAYMSGPEAASLFAAPDGRPMEALARESLREALRETEGAGPPIHRVWRLFLGQRLRRETALSMAEFGSVVETRLPYLDGELVEALMAAPPELKLGDRIQSHILRRRMPAFLDVVNANTGARMGAGPLERSLARARLKILAKLGVRGYQPYERMGAWLRLPLRPVVERLLLDDRCLGRGLLDPDTVRAVVCQHLDGGRNHTFLLLALMIFEVGQRTLIDGGGGGGGPEGAGRLGVVAGSHRS